MLTDFIVRDPETVARKFAEALLQPVANDTPSIERAKFYAELARINLSWFVNPDYLLIVWKEMKEDHNELHHQNL